MERRGRGEGAGRRRKGGRRGRARGQGEGLLALFCRCISPLTHEKPSEIHLWRRKRVSIVSSRSKRPTFAEAEQAPLGERREGLRMEDSHRHVAEPRPNSSIRWYRIHISVRHVRSRRRNGGIIEGDLPSLQGLVLVQIEHVVGE